MLNKGLSEAGSSLGKTWNEKHPFNFIKTSPLGQLSITDNSFGPKLQKFFQFPLIIGSLFRYVCISKVVTITYEHRVDKFVKLSSIKKLENWNEYR